MTDWLCRPQVALCDITNFYCSAERAFDPTLRGKPLIIASNNDSCAVARSAEVKALGIKMGEPLYKLQSLIDSKKIFVRSSNYSLYHDMSERFKSILSLYTDEVHQYSVDECFLHFKGFSRNFDLEVHCEKAVAHVKAWTSMPCAAGIAPTKTLAKCCTHFAKTLGLPGSVLALKSEYHRQQLLKQLEVGEVWGVGRRTRNSLVAFGIVTAWDLATAHIPTLRKSFGVTLERTIRELNGEPCIVLQPLDTPKQEIVSGRTFGQRLSDFPSVMASIANHVQQAAEKLRAQSGLARKVSVSISTSPFDSKQPYRQCGAYTDLRPATDALPTLLEAARSCLQDAWLDGLSYHRSSITLSELCTDSALQPDLFAQNSKVEHARIDHCLENINRRFGRGTAALATTKLSDSWEMRREWLSPAYTTDFSQLATAVCD